MKSSIENEENQEKVHLFFGKYRILKRIGCGSFGNVYKGINIIDKKNVAIKVEKKDEGYNLLQKESYYLYNLRGIGVPELISYGYSGKYNVLVQTLLGESLGKIFFKNSNRFSLKDICMFTIQILHRIEFVHSKYLIHRDIKPENFLIGSPDEYMIYIIDFGLSKKYKSSRTNKHIQFKLTKKFTGTARYASINAVRGAEQSRRDDLEAIGYMLMFFFNGGKLPWQGVSCKEKAQKYAKIYQMKKNLNYAEFCKNMPKEIITYMMYCRELQFEKEPNYEYLRDLFENVLRKNCFQNDLKFSWIKDYSILNNIEEIKLKIFPNNNICKRKQSPQSRIYKKLESAREYNKENENQESTTNYKLLISNNSQNNLLQKSNPILKANTFSFKYNIGHKRFNSSWDAGAILKGKESDMLKSSIAKYNSSIDDEEAINNIHNSNLNFSNNEHHVLNRDTSKHNLFYFSNFNDLSKSFALKNNNNENNMSTNIIKNDNNNTNNANMVKKTYTSFIKNDNNNTNTNNNIIINNKIINKNFINKQNKNNNNNHHSPNIIKSLSYVKKYKNKIDEIKINFKQNKKFSKNTRNINTTNPLTNNESNLNTKTKNKSLNIIYTKKNTSNRKNDEVKKPCIKNNIIINPISVNKNKNFENYKIKLKKYGNNIPKNKIEKLVKPKPQNINIQISPTSINSRSFTNLLKKSSNNNTNQTQSYIINNPTLLKISKPNLKKVNIKMHNLSPNLSNNVEGKINKIKTMIIHNSNMKKDKKAHNNTMNTDLIFTENSNDFININQKRINKYKNMRHKMEVKSNNLTLTQNDNNNNSIKTIPKYRPINKTINSTINNSNNTITNTINSNNNNNTIISIYNNYNINNNKNNSTNEIYKTQNGININLDTLNNTKNKKHNNNSIYFSYNGYNVNSYQNYIHLNTRKSPMMINTQKINKIVSFPSMLPKLKHDNDKNNKVFNSQIINNPIEYSYQDDEPKDNLRNYFSINGNVSLNDRKKNIPLNLSSVRLNLNSLKIKKILSDLKYNESTDNTLKKNKNKFANSNGNIFDNTKNKKIINKIDHNLNNNINRNNSYQYGKKINYKNIMNKYNNQKMDFEYYYPTINRKKTDIFYQKLPEFKMNFDIDDSYLTQENRNNTPSFRRHEQNRDYLNKRLKENKFVSLKL